MILEKRVLDSWMEFSLNYGLVFMCEDVHEGLDVFPGIAFPGIRWEVMQVEKAK